MTETDRKNNEHETEEDKLSLPSKKHITTRVAKVNPDTVLILVNDSTALDTIKTVSGLTWHLMI